MNLRAYRTLQALVLAGLGFFLLSRVWTGKILLYINQRFVILVFLAGLGLIILAQVVLRERPTRDRAEGKGGRADLVSSSTSWTLWWLALPLLLGLLLPAKPLSASVLANRGINTSAPLSVRIEDSQYSLTLAPTERTVLDWIRLFSQSEDPRQFSDQPVDVTGFVFQDVRLSPGQFMVGRFTITCCVADALALGMVVNWPGVEGLVDNTWVRVRGSIVLTELDGRTLPMIRAETVEMVDQPEQPYLFP